MLLTGFALTLLLAAVASTDGADELLHATVTLEDGRVLTGVLREDSADACRHLLFTAYRANNPWSEFIDDDARLDRRVRRSKPDQLPRYGR